ncbi:hypothetical protein HH212_18865 [Massilia forsythiae]|uniref:TIGR00374 family protein n=1 Tax=Massilia forsythiae TaxID=2728020 RepID=A0A7Z2VYL7_9BURK|nr:lysylphosphatidylglycerol synthase domain-containing protein [Massilia forsythiae]QJE01831.1 hypothetical protein HH212_18865 [Massilia forsythiae]
MNRLAWLGASVGLAVLAALVAWQGWDAVVSAFSHAGWALLLLLPLRLATLALDALAWRVLLARADPARRARLPFLLWVACVRDAVNRLLPVAGIGGEVVGVRLAGTRIRDNAALGASVIVEVLLTMLVLTLFCGAGLVLMARLAAGLDQLGTLAAALALGVPLPLLAWLLLRHGAPFGRLVRCLRAALVGLGLRREIAANLDGARLDRETAILLAQRDRLARAFGWQAASWLLGSAETWYALLLLGHPVSVGAAVAIEALTQAARHAGFLVPAGLGVQEAAMLLFGHLAGVGGDVALSLALVKRMRELLTGIPALLSWHWFETRRLMAPRCAPPDT